MTEGAVTISNKFLACLAPLRFRRWYLIRAVYISGQARIYNDYFFTWRTLRICIDDSSDVLGCCDYASGSQAQFRNLVHFHEYREVSVGETLTTALGRCSLLECHRSTMGISMLRLRRACLPRFHLQQVHLPRVHLRQVRLQPVNHPCQSERAPHTKPFSSLSRPGKRQRSPTTLSSSAQALKVGYFRRLFWVQLSTWKKCKERPRNRDWWLPFHSHCLNSSHPTGFDEDCGQQNDIFPLFHEKYKFSPDTDVSNWNGGPMYNLGGRGAAWGLFSPRVRDEILAHQFAPRTELHDELVRTWYRAAKDLMGLLLLTTTPAHQNLMEHLNVKNNFRNNRNVQWQWGRIASEFRDQKNFDFARGAYSTIDKLLEIAMSKRRRKDGVLEEHKNWSIILHSEVRSIIWDDNDFYQAVGVVVRDKTHVVVTSIKLRADANGQALRTSNIILAAGSVQSPAILLRSGKKNFLESKGGLHLTDHDIFANGYSFHYLNPGDREQIGSMKSRHMFVSEMTLLMVISPWQTSHWCRFFSSQELYAQSSLWERKFPQVHRYFHPTCTSEWEEHHRARCRWRAHCDHTSRFFIQKCRQARRRAKEAMQVLQKALSIEIMERRRMKTRSFSSPLGLVESLTSLGLFRCWVDLACRTASKLTSNSGVIREYTSATSPCSLTLQK